MLKFIKIKCLFPQHLFFSYLNIVIIIFLFKLKDHEISQDMLPPPALARYCYVACLYGKLQK